MVTVVNELGERIEITDKIEMENAILASNMSKFSQSLQYLYVRKPVHPYSNKKHSIPRYRVILSLW